MAPTPDSTSGALKWKSYIGGWLINPIDITIDFGWRTAQLPHELMDKGPAELQRHAAGATHSPANGRRGHHFDQRQPQPLNGRLALPVLFDGLADYAGPVAGY
jgi:hypothetical protein